MKANAVRNAPAGSTEVPPQAMVPSVDLSIIIPALNEGPNLALLLPEIRAVVEDLGVTWEILIVTREVDSQTLAAAGKVQALVLEQQERGYGGALVAAFRAARGAYLL